MDAGPWKMRPRSDTVRFNRTHAQCTGRRSWKLSSVDRRWAV